MMACLTLLMLVLWTTVAMAQIVLSTLANGVGQNNVDLVTYTSGSIDPPDGQLTLAVVGCSHDDLTTEAPTLTGNDLTWTQIATVAGKTATDERRITLFRAMGVASAGTVTMTHSVSMRGCAWAFLTASGTDISGTNGSGAIVQVKTNFSDTAVTALTVTFDAALSNPATGVVFFAIVTQINEAISPEAGYTELFEEIQVSRFMTLEGHWDVGGDQTPSATWTTATVTAAVAIEIRAPAVASRRFMVVH